MMTPFSGLSLFLHLAIIGTAKVLGFIRGDMLAAAYNRGPLAKRGIGRFANSLVSVMIVVFISTVMLSFIGIAITTGIREGTRESHLEFIAEAVEKVQEGQTYFYSRQEAPPTDPAPAKTPTTSPTPKKQPVESPTNEQTERPSLVISI